MEPGKLFQTMHDNSREKPHLQKQKDILNSKHGELYILPPLWLFILYHN